ARAVRPVARPRLRRARAAHDAHRAATLVARRRLRRRRGIRRPRRSRRPARVRGRAVRRPGGDGTAHLLHDRHRARHRRRRALHDEGALPRRSRHRRGLHRAARARLPPARNGGRRARGAADGARDARVRAAALGAPHGQHGRRALRVPRRLSRPGRPRLRRNRVEGLSAARVRHVRRTGGTDVSALELHTRLRPLSECVVVVTPRSFGMHDAHLREDLERTVGTVRYRPGPLDAAELAELLGDADGLLAGVDEIDAHVFERAPRLRVVARYGVGVDRIDLDADAVAELTIALLFAVARPLAQGRDAARAGDWHALPGVELAGKTLGLVGLGRIGRLVAAKARGLGMRVLAHDPYVEDGGDAQLVDLETLCTDADVVSLHAPLTDETRGLVDRRFLEHLKPGAALVNTARAGLVDEDALLAALETGRLRAA